MEINLTLGPKYAGDSDIVNIAENEESIVVHYKALPGKMHAYITIGKDTLTEWYREYSGGGSDFTLNSLLNEFRSVVDIDSSFTLTYAYLQTMFNAAEDEWENNTHGFFNSSMYPELPEVEALTIYRGNNEPVGVNLKNVMTSWTIAMCLAELVPTESTGGVGTEYYVENNQTKIFKIAYNIGLGRDCPLYGGYSLHNDPMIIRLAASAVYVLIRGAKTTTDIAALRSEINTKLSTNYAAIIAAGFSDLGWNGSSGNLPTKIGYLINTDTIMTASPGPFTTGHESQTTGGVNRYKPYEQGQPDSLFCKSTSETGYQNWWLYNYYVDIAVDNIVCQNYIMAVPEGSSASDIQDLRDLWDSYSLDKKQLMMSAVSAPYATKRFFFGSRIVHFNGITLGKYTDFQDSNNIANGWTNPLTGVTYKNNKTYYGGTPVEGVSQPTYYFYNFTEGSTSPSYTVSGPFADLENKLFRSRTYGDVNTTTYPFFDELLDIGDNSRYPSYRVDYGRRRRPLGGEISGDPRVDSFGDTRNGITNGSLSMLFASDSDSHDKYNCIDDWSQDGATSYPSGHSSQCMTVGLMLGQMFADSDPSKINQYVAAAYRLGVGRTITRHHWQSDIIYGRLCATMILPIVNAMSNGSSSFMSKYEDVRSELGASASITVSITLTNNSSNSITILNRYRLVLKSGNLYNRTAGKLGTPSNTSIINNDGTFTIPSGMTVTFQNAEIDSINYLGKYFLDMTNASDPSYIAYMNGHSEHPYNTYLYHTNGTAVGDTNYTADRRYTSNISSNLTLERGQNYNIAIENPA